MTTIEQLGGLTAQHNEIIKRVVNGALNPISVKRALQDIIEGNVILPSFVEKVKLQIMEWEKLGVVVSHERWKSIIRQAELFQPFTATDEPLVTGGFGYDNAKAMLERLFRAFTPPDGYTSVNYIWDAELRYVPGMEPTGELRLVHYDPNAHVGFSPVGVRKAVAKQEGLWLAGIEVLEYLVLSPQLVTEWDGKLSPYPYLSGIELESDGNWLYVPSLSSSLDTFELSSFAAEDSHGSWASPTVREC